MSDSGKPDAWAQVHVASNGVTGTHRDQGFVERGVAADNAFAGAEIYRVEPLFRSPALDELFREDVVDWEVHLTNYHNIDNPWFVGDEATARDQLRDAFERFPEHAPVLVRAITHRVVVASRAPEEGIHG